MIDIYKLTEGFDITSTPKFTKDGHTMFLSDVVKDLNYWRNKTLELQAENAELKKRSEWISVDDELPEFNKVVLVRVYRERGATWPDADYSCAAKLSQVTRHCGENSPIDNRWSVFPSGGAEITRDVTHWMPIPTKGE